MDDAPRMEAPIVVGLGELLWDCFPDKNRPGGAPANVAFQSQQLGLRGAVCSRVGRDERGDELVRFLAAHGLATLYVQRDEEHQTSYVTIEFDASGEPQYSIHENVAWDFLQFDATAEELMRGARAVCFGTLAQRNSVACDMIHQCIAATRPDCRIVYDVNLREPWYDVQVIERSLRAAHVVKLNVREVDVVSHLLKLDAPRPEPFAERMFEHFDVDLVCVTRSAEGCWLRDRQRTAQQPGISIERADPVGAGDAFTSALIYTLIQRWPLHTAAEFANHVAARVASRAGAMPDLGKELIALAERMKPE
ncbi:MAG: carbohydrate kinase [Pirellulales bacterium]